MEYRLKVWNGKSVKKNKYIKRINRRLFKLGEPVPGFLRILASSQRKKINKPIKN